VSDSYGYRLRLLAPGWQLPQDRWGVATSIEAVRDDHSALLALSFEPADKDATLDRLAEAYEKRIKDRVPEAGPAERKAATLGGQPAVLLVYQAKAIDGEPTESRHVMALESGLVWTLTFVSKKGSLEENAKHFDEALKLFQFGKAAESRPQE
jgi:hypothetical protein